MATISIAAAAGPAARRAAPWHGLEDRRRGAAGRL